MNDDRILLEARGLTKQYGVFLALDHADIDLKGGQVHALVKDRHRSREFVADSCASRTRFL